MIVSLLSLQPSGLTNGSNQAHAQPNDTFDFSAFTNENMSGDLSNSFSYPLPPLHEYVPRPSSSRSHRSSTSISDSDHSYTTTEVDSDDAMAEFAAIQAALEAQGVPEALSGVAGMALSGERSYPNLRQSGAATIDVGVLRGIGGSAEEEKKRKEWLERESLRTCVTCG